MDLVIVTASYPFDGALEQTFLEPELEILRTRFEHIVLVPQSLDGIQLSAPGDPVVRTDYAQSVATRSAELRHILRGVSPRRIATELRSRPTLLGEPKGIIRLFRFLLRASAMEHWMYRYAAERPSVERDTIFYTWWADATTMGLGMAKSRLPGLFLVSRAHSTDLYPSRHTPPYLPCRAAMYRALDRLFPDSERGADFVRERYKWFASRCTASRQGVADPGFRTSPSSDGVFRVVSCSFIIPRKRLSLIVRGLAEAAGRRPNQRIEWTHIGDGPLRASVEQEVAALRHPNLTGRILGMLSPDQMLDFYRTQPIDLFANASDNEGTPVSLMEAASCGMPILATAVGGNVEVVSEDVGVLLSEHPDAAEVADGMLRIVDEPDNRLRLREGARRRWASQYDSVSNYRHFANELVAMREAHSPISGG